MRSLSSWVFAIVIALCILGLVAYDHPDRQSYWTARAAQALRTQATPLPTPKIPPSFFRR